MTVRKVLCVDDSAAELDLIRKIVSSANLDVVTATNGKDALQCAKSHLPDLIFLDIVMVGMDGFAVMRELQKDPVTSDIPVVFVSSKNQKADQAWAKMQGAKGFVPKPVSEEAILEELKKFC
jgi:twitching motility two-component system response regulator PilH